MTRRLVGSLWLAAGICLALRVWYAQAALRAMMQADQYDRWMEQLFWGNYSGWLFALAAVLGLLGVGYLLLAEFRADDRLRWPRRRKGPQ